MLREALKIRERKIPDDWRTFNAQHLLGAALAGQGRRDISEPLLVSGYEGMKQREDTMGVNRTRLADALERLVRFYSDSSGSGDAAEWQRKLDAARNR